MIGTIEKTPIMKNTFLLLFLAFITFSCEKEQSSTFNKHNTSLKRNNANLVEVCHYDALSKSYRTMRVNARALPGHLRHGDVAGPCTSCDLECLFCKYIDMLDFDEPCETNSFATGDYYCSRDISDGCSQGELFEIKGESTVWDNDYFRNISCNGDDEENDEGFFFAVYEISCTGVPFGQVQFYYRNYDTGEIINEEFFEASQEAYDLAVYCRSIIDGIAAQNSMPNDCVED